MEQSPITEQQYSIYSERICTNASDYLKKNKMGEPGVWGGDLEIFVFCYLFNVRISVYVLSLKKWVVYSHQLDEESKDMFMINWGNHWEPVSSIVPLVETETQFITNIFINSSTSGANFVRKRPLFAQSTETVSKVRKVSHVSSTESRKETSHLLHDHEKCFHRLFIMGPQSENLSFDSTRANTKSNPLHDNVSFKKCQKCCSMSTLWYPFELVPIDLSSTKKRKFGNNLRECSDLCPECLSYVRNDCSWKYAWPSVVFTLAFQRKNAQFLSLFLQLPLQIKASWLLFEPVLNNLGNQNDLFQDITRDRSQHRRLIESYLVSDFKKVISSYSLPSVECFCGGSEFIDCAGSISFQHLINYVDNSFKSFQADW